MQRTVFTYDKIDDLLAKLSVERSESARQIVVDELDGLTKQRTQHFLEKLGVILHKLNRMCEYSTSGAIHKMRREIRAIVEEGSL